MWQLLGMVGGGALLVGLAGGGFLGYKIGNDKYEDLVSKQWEQAARANADTIALLQDRARAVGDATNAKQELNDADQKQIQIVRQILYRTAPNSAGCTPANNPVISALLNSVQFSRPASDKAGGPADPGKPTSLQAPTAGAGDKAGR